MKRAAKKTAYILLAALMLASMLLCGCVKEKKKGAQGGKPVRLAEQTEEPMPRTKNPLTVTTRVTEESGCLMRYPYVTNAGMSVLNLSLISAFSEFTANCELENAEISYTVEFNKLGVLSLMLFCTSGDGRVLYEDTANFDCFTGLRVYLPDLFAQDANYKDRLSLLVTKEIEARGLTTISDLPPMDESRPFLFTHGGIYVVYREYELCTHDAGTVKLLVRKSLISDLADPEGPITRLG
ncbi:MAG: RsiV family protein [Clostridiales bacterium]|nr:RsiV family protein [Clostridiales bacterium]